MQISIIDISPETSLTNKNGKPYKQLEVTYKNSDGKVSSKKMFDFNKGAYEGLKAAKKGDLLEITTVKEGDYWTWTAAHPTSAEQSYASNKGTDYIPKPAQSSGTYATKEERQATQVMIVRQNALTNAVTLLKSDKAIPDSKKVTELAQELANWTLGVEKKDPNNFDDLPDDIPT